jgi:putative transcriptional regulator
MKPSVAERILQGLQEFTKSLEGHEVISEKFTCRKIDLNLIPKPYDPKKVKKTRKLLGTSQAMFALFLGVSVKTVRSWEQGINTPSVMACRFMDEIQRDPPYWIRRLKEAVVVK